MQIDNYAPVIIPTLNRYEHLKRCVESLAHCTHADKTELIIGLDYPPSEKYEEGWKKIREYLPTITGFEKVTVLFRKKNLGAVANMNDLIDHVFKSKDCYIFTEDDNVFSPCFLEFINKGLEKYKEVEQVSAICGYTHQEMYHISTNNVFCGHSVPAYGVGRWKDIDEKYRDRDYNWAFKELKRNRKRSFSYYRTHPSLLFMLVSMIWSRTNYGDLLWCFNNLQDGTFSISPSVSMVRNLGCDGSGLHSGYVSGLDKQEIMTQEHFEPDDIELIITDEYKRRYRMRNMPSGFFARQFNKLYKFTIVSIFLLFDNRKNADEPFSWFISKVFALWKRGSKMKTAVNKATAS